MPERDERGSAEGEISAVSGYVPSGFKVGEWSEAVAKKDLITGVAPTSNQLDRTRTRVQFVLLADDWSESNRYIVGSTIQGLESALCVTC